MEKSPTYLKVIGVLGTLAGLIGFIMAIKVPGNLALAPLFVGLILGLFAFLIAKNKKTKCASSWIALLISIVGIVMSLVIQATTEPTIAVDEKQEQVIEQTNDAITEGDDLDNALDELDDSEEGTE